MEDEDYEDYLVDKAKEILNEEVTDSSPESVDKPDMSEIEERPGTTGDSPGGMENRNHLDEAENSKEFSGRRNSSNFDRAEQDSTSRIPFSWDPREVEHLTRNRKEMTNEELEEFMERDSEFQEKMDEVDEWKGFSRWEERLMVQQHSVKTPEEIAEELDRDTREVELKMHIMGLVRKDE